MPKTNITNAKKAEAKVAVAAKLAEAKAAKAVSKAAAAAKVAAKAAAKTAVCVAMHTKVAAKAAAKQAGRNLLKEQLAYHRWQKACKQQKSAEAKVFRPCGQCHDGQCAQFAPNVSYLASFPDISHFIHRVLTGNSCVFCGRVPRYELSLSCLKCPCCLVAANSLIPLHVLADTCSR